MRPAHCARGIVRRPLPCRSAEVLFNYLPFTDEPALEEEVLASIGKLTVHGARIDALLLAALKDGPADKRAAAVYIVGQRGDPGVRELVRAMLVDPDPAAQSSAAAGLIGKQALAQMQENVQSDVSVVRKDNMDADAPSLIRFLEKRTLSEADQKRLRALVDELGHTVWAKREKATRALIDEKMTALPFLKGALDDSDPERVTRARQCIKAIRDGPTTNAVAVAVVRLLALAGESRK